MSHLISYFFFTDFPLKRVTRTLFKLLQDVIKNHWPQIYEPSPTGTTTSTFSNLQPLILTLFHLGGLFDPLYHESVSRIYRTRTRFTKFHDFVLFGICQDPAKLFLKFFSKNIKIFDVEFFFGVLKHK